MDATTVKSHQERRKLKMSFHWLKSELTNEYISSTWEKEHWGVLLNPSLCMDVRLGQLKKKKLQN